MPIGKMVKIVQKEPHQECEPIYEKVFAWIEESGKRLVSPKGSLSEWPTRCPPRRAFDGVYTPIE